MAGIDFCTDVDDEHRSHYTSTGTDVFGLCTNTLCVFCISGLSRDGYLHAWCVSHLCLARSLALCALTVCVCVNSVSHTLLAGMCLCMCMHACCWHFTIEWPHTLPFDLCAFVRVLDRTTRVRMAKRMLLPMKPFKNPKHCLHCQLANSDMLWVTDYQLFKLCLFDLAH